MAQLVWKGRPHPGAAQKRPRDAGVIGTDEVHGSDRKGAWHNRLVHGDATRLLPALARELAGEVALVYIDPPFDTGGTFHFQAGVPGAPHGSPRVSVPAYRDARGLDAWLSWFFAVAGHLRDLLAPGGSLYVHLDTHVAHYAKVLLDEIFGAGGFQREIVWRIGWVSGFKSRANNWIRNHDVILFYAKGGSPGRPVFHKEYIPYPDGYVRRDGTPPRGPGYPLDDVWNGSELDPLDSIQIMSFSGEKVGFPTQKNESLVARIVRASSRPGDIVLDCFVGSGTTAVVAEKLGRRWMACDASPVAIHAARKRLLAVDGVRPFLVQTGPAHRAAPSRRVSARVVCRGPSARVELHGFTMPVRAAPREARDLVHHWSQWIDAFVVDWESDGGPLRVGSRVVRGRRQTSLPLSAEHRYESPGRYDVLVRVYDVLGGVTTKRLRAAIEA